MGAYRCTRVIGRLFLSRVFTSRKSVSRLNGRFSPSIRTSAVGLGRQVTLAHELKPAKYLEGDIAEACVRCGPVDARTREFK